MNGPKLQATDISGEKGMAPPRLKAWLRTLPADDRAIVEWVIQNFVPNEGDSSGGAGGNTLDLQVCIGGEVKTVTFLVSRGPH